LKNPLYHDGTYRKKADRDFNHAKINRFKFFKASNTDDGFLSKIKSFLFPWSKRSATSKPIIKVAEPIKVLNNSVLVLGATGKTGFNV